MNGSGILGVGAALAFTLGLLALAVYLLRRLSGATWSRTGQPLRTVGRLALGPRQAVTLVSVPGRVLMLGVTDHSITMLGELPPDALPPAADAPPSGPPGFPAFLRRALPLTILLALVSAPLMAQGVPPVPEVAVRIGQGTGALELSGTVGLVVFLGALTLLPALFLLMTSFTRILIVLHFLRSALGTQTAPPNQLLVALAVLLTGVVMHPALTEAHRDGLQPYVDGRITQVEAYRRTLAPFRRFMEANTREQDLALFVDLSGATVDSTGQAPLAATVAAFVTSELRTAFQMGFVIYLPFVVVDVVVASVLMSLGMFMLPPPMISLPFKLLLFVLADGWTLVVQNLAASFR